MIEIKNIHKKFGKLEVLKGLSGSFLPGQCVALIGPNGCGKTTLIKIILGMVLPDKGSVEVYGKDIRNQVDYRSDIGYMPQIGRYPENMRMGEVLDMITGLRSAAAEKDLELMEQFAIEGMRGKIMRTLSGGTIQKVSACIAFLFNPNILILDEPTAGLDPIAAELMKDKILKAREEGKLILITSHLLNELEELITHIMYVHEGGVLFHDSVNLLLEQTGESRISKAIPQLMRQSYAV